MSYLRKISVNFFHHFKYKLSNTQKGICLILAASLIVKIGELVFKLIVENQYMFGIIIGIIILAIGIYLYLKHQITLRNNHKLYDEENKNNSTRNYDINTGGGNFNRVVEGNYIQGDYINIQDNRVDMSKDISSILDDFRAILTEMKSQGYNTQQAATQMAKELAAETRKNPYVKGKFHIDENADDTEVFEFMRLLILNNHLFNQTTGEEGAEDDGEETIYQRHTVYLESDRNDYWYYKINGPLCNESGKSLLTKDMAIDEAKKKIDEARFSNW